jgi:hypothetical protein
MACTITQADLGPTFEDVDADLASLYIEIATTLVLGPEGACATANYAKWFACCVDPCMAIRLLASHLIASDPDSGAGSSEVTSESVGEISATYGSVTSSSGLFATTHWGRGYAKLLGAYEQCKATRRTFPVTAANGSCGCP